MNAPSSAKTLIISYVGMEEQRVDIKPNVRVTLRANAEMLDEVMVVAYGTAKKSSFTGSASTINNEKLESRPISNVTKLPVPVSRVSLPALLSVVSVLSTLRSLRCM